MKKALSVSAIIIIAIASLTALFATNMPPKGEQKKPEAYLGVTYCGDSVGNGKLLIDKVKNYTNLFVLQSGTLQRNFKSVDELGDYAISNGLDFLPYFGMILPQFSDWLINATQRWGTHLIGVYYADEPGGKMLDDYTTFNDSQTGDSITKTTYGDILVQKPNGTKIVYEIGGNIRVLEQANTASTSSPSEKTNIYITFSPEGNVSAAKPNPTTLENELIQNYTTLTTYQDLMNAKPLKDMNDIANRFIVNDQTNIQMIKKSTKLFTSDYALYWFDYLSGYDVILAQVGWNNSLTQQIAFERGAAKLQNRDWGIIITWKYDRTPYLASREEIFNQMQTAYNSGAKYIIIFDYYENQANPYGTMQEEHFNALEDFWNKVIKNPDEKQSQIADSALVLPQNYGCAFRWKEDKIWGVIQPNQTTVQIFSLIQNTITNNTLNWDIVYEDAKIPLNGNYQQTLYWNQTK